ncbi:midasin, partial [Reticulomyxa filosa]
DEKERESTLNTRPTTTTTENETLKREWQRLKDNVYGLEQMLHKTRDQFAFAFVKGLLIECVEKGHWLLLDEINLANSEALGRICGILDSGGSTDEYGNHTGSVVLIEKGETKCIPRHPNFRLFANMNPPTDYGKKNLAGYLRNHFTELYVNEIEEQSDLEMIVRHFILRKINPQETSICSQIVTFYLGPFQYAVVDTCLGIRVQNHKRYSLLRALYEGFVMVFVTPLREESKGEMEQLVKTMILSGKDKRQLKEKEYNLHFIPSLTDEEQRLYRIEQTFVLKLGTVSKDNQAFVQPFIRTETMEKRLKDLCRVVGSGKNYPVLLEGPTSSGKTSLVEYLAHATQHKCVRINNHEHTDMDEYIGCYVTDPLSGKLIFEEGILIKAMRNGWWVILDELNLAPSE